MLQEIHASQHQISRALQISWPCTLPVQRLTHSSAHSHSALSCHCMAGLFSSCCGRLRQMNGPAMTRWSLPSEGRRMYLQCHRAALHVSHVFRQVLRGRQQVQGEMHSLPVIHGRNYHSTSYLIPRPAFALCRLSL